MKIYGTFSHCLRVKLILKPKHSPLIDISSQWDKLRFLYIYLLINCSELVVNLLSKEKNCSINIVVTKITSAATISGILIKPGQPAKIISEKAATSGKRGSLVAVVIAVNEYGNSVLPHLLVPSKYFKQHFLSSLTSRNILFIMLGVPQTIQFMSFWTTLCHT